MSVGQRWAAKRGPLSTFLVLLLPLSFFLFLSFFLILSLLKANKASVGLKAKRLQPPHFLSLKNSPPSTVSLLPVISPSFLAFFLNISVTQYNYTHIKIQICHIASHTILLTLQCLISYMPTWEPSSLGALLRSCENVLLYACL